MNPSDLDFIFNLWLNGFLLTFARMLGFVFLSPPFTENNLPVMIKTAIALLLTILSVSFVKSAPIDMQSYNYFFGLAINFTLGALIGFIANFVLVIAEMTGEIIDKQTGLDSASVMTGGVQSTLFKIIIRSLTLLIFMYMGGMYMVIYCLKISFDLFPLTANDFSLLGIQMTDIISLASNAIVLGVTTASPLMVIIIFQDIILALMSRAAHQINPFQLSYSLKPIVGLIVVILCLPLMQQRISEIVKQETNIFKVYDLSTFNKSSIP